MRIQETSDAQLARRCRGGEPDAWRELVRRHGPMVHRLALRMLGAGSEADDAFQQTFIRVRRSFDGYDPTRPLKPWISRIAYNVCLRRLGKTARARSTSVDESALATVADASEPGPEARVAAGEAEAALVSALDDLAADDRAMVLMRYREGLSVAEVAEATGMPANTVKTRLHRARGALRAILGPLLRGGSE